MPFAALMLFPLTALAHAQESAALFDAPLVTLGTNDRFGFLTDLDHDGFQDAVSWWWTTPEQDRVRLRGLRNDGTGKFVQRWTKVVLLDTGCPAVRVLACQLDSDGNTDICVVAAGGFTASIRALRSQGLAAPELMTDYSITRTGLTSAPEVRAVMTDFTGDGLADLAYSADGNLRLMEFVPGQPGLTLRSSTNPFGSFNAIKGLLEIDANGDATPDLLAWRDGTIQLIEVQDLQPTVTHTYFPGITDYKPATGDIDGDGDRDLVMWGTSRYAVLRRTGPANWSMEPLVTGGQSEFLFDADGDGDLDGVCCGSGDPSIPDNLILSTFRVSVNDGTGGFAPALETPWLGSDHLAGIADLDHDGDLDVVSGRCILYARGPLTQRLHPLLDSTQTSRTMADIDGDSDPDFTIGMRTMKRNLGDGRLADYAGSFPAPPPGTQFVGPGWPGDFDGDGDVDLVVKHFAGTTLLAQRLLTNLGGGAFADAGDAGPSGVDFSSGSTYLPDNPEASLAADADGDGDLDLVTRSYSGGVYHSRIWWSDGVGYFTAGPEFLNEFISWVGDLTGDGIPDLAGVTKTCSYCEDAGWNRGLGGGAFGHHVTLSPVDYQPIPFAVADLDADGDLDLAIAFLFDLNVYWNDGSGVFTAEWVSSIRLSNSSQSHQVWSSDCDGDGRLDLVVTGSERDPACLTILRRRADNAGWQAPLSQVIHPSSYNNLDGVLCDVDGDGDQDFVTNKLVRNSTHALPDGGRRRQVGAGSPGTGGLVPTLGAQGPFRVGESAELRIRGGVGGATGLLLVTLVRGGQPGANGGWLARTDAEPVLSQVPFTLSGTPGVAGAGSWSRSITVPPAFAGQIRRYVVEINDPAGSGGVATPNTLLISYGP